jgi:hypothetical protein
MKELQKILTEDEFNRLIYNLYRTPKRIPSEGGFLFKRSSHGLVQSFYWDYSKESMYYWSYISSKIIKSQI